MMRMRLLICPLLLAASAALAAGETACEENQTHHAAPVGSYGGIMNPDISAIINTQVLFTDNRLNELRGNVRISEAEVAFQSYLYPGIAGNLIIAMHEEGGEWDIHPEEAYVAFQDLRFGFQALVGRKLMTFGRLNPMHPHHWKFADQPLPLTDFFGEHAFFDDGAQVDWLVPNPWNIYGKLALGAWSGGSGTAAGHHHHEDADAEHEEHAQSLEWQGRIYNGRANFDVPLGEISNAAIGYSVVWDEGYRTFLHGADLTITYRRPTSYTRVQWQSELYYADTDDENVTNPSGLLSTVSLTLNQYWEMGVRCDWSEFIRELEPEEGEEAGPSLASNHEWSLSAFISYHFTHSMYLRPGYRRIVDRFDGEENQFIVQLVWGLGPHAHRLED